jgi:transposase InsO family protein
MSKRVSPTTGKPYRVRRVCRAWGIPRSSFYARGCPRTSSENDEEVPSRKKPGPKPEISDSELTSLIREGLSNSPFSGEGHRKVWARLRFQKGIRVSQKRVLALMRENGLLSPHRVPQRPPREHTGRIVTDSPNEMWGTDGARVFTLRDGWGWIFACLDHWNAECLGFHVTKRGGRFSALEPVAQGILSRFGSVERGAARGLSLRIDHGSQYLSDHFQKQIKAWRITPSFAFLEQPQAGGGWRGSSVL